MSLSASFQIGRSALTASQLAIQVVGDNLANVATPGFSRRVASFSAAPGAGGVAGVSIGNGVRIADISRRLDESLLTRLRASISDQAGAQVANDLFSQVDSITNDLGELGLSTQLSTFFNAFSELANNPLSGATKSLIVEQGVSLSNFIQGLRSNLVTLRTQVDQQLGDAVKRADSIFSEIASLNSAISTSELGTIENSALRDQRDQLLAELSELVDVSVIGQSNGMVDVRIGSTPVVQGAISRGMQLNITSENGDVVAKVVVPGTLDERVFPDSGRIGGLLQQRDGLIDGTISDLDSIAANLIFEVNRIHSSGQSFPGLTSTVSERIVPIADRTLALNDPANTTFASLPFAAGNGSFDVLVRDIATGQTTRITIDIDLDGIDATGAPGFTDDTTLVDIQSALNAAPNLTASLGPDGRLSLTAAPGFEFGFADDTSGVLAALGVNTYFKGTSAKNIGVRQELIDNPQLLVVGSEQGANEAALAIAGVQERAVTALDGLSISGAFRQTTGRIAVSAASARTRADAETQVRAGLEAQRAIVSGVSVDEESINLISFQRQYQAAARFISTVDELTQTLIALV